MGYSIPSLAPDALCSSRFTLHIEYPCLVSYCITVATAFLDVSILVVTIHVASGVATYQVYMAYCWSQSPSPINPSTLPVQPQNLSISIVGGETNQDSRHSRPSPSPSSSPSPSPSPTPNPTL